VDEAGVAVKWAGTDADYPADATMAGLFAAQVARDADATALVSGTASVSYGELDRRSNALAWLLRRRGVGVDVPVGVAIGRGIDLVVALLAVLKAGGAYLPIDVNSPPPRVAAMIEAAGARLVLVTAQTADAVPGLAGVDAIGVDSEPVLAADEAAAPPDVAHPLSLAYLSFTSGSTGVPKGVAVPHRAVIRLVSDPVFAPLGPGQRLLHLSPVAFDASTLEIWGALLTGATVVIAPPGPLGLAEIAALLRNAGVTVAWLTAGLFHQVAETDIDALAAVPVVLAGGDVLDPGTVRAVLAARGGRPLVNGYGPTENTTFTTCHVMTDPGQVGATVPIGRPIQHTTVQILDAQAQPVPAGVTGELYAGGDGLARGYAGNAAATARAFVPDPSGHGTRLYRTGDLARWRADGTLEFAGRTDDQVKLRGFRVEPGEVAAVLRDHPAVREAFVAVERSGPADPRLIGYVAAEATPAELIEYTASRLPSYLTPAAIVVLPALPLTPSGKVDRAALPAPGRAAAGLTEVAVAHRTPTEGAVASIMARLLGKAVVGAEDDFFALGGSSLLVGRLAAEITAELQVTVTMADLLHARTVAGIAVIVDQRAGQAHPQTAPAALERDLVPAAPAPPPVRPGRRDQPVRLSLQQERVWFFEQLSPGNLAYNFQATVSLHGEVNAGALRAALDEIVRRHEILRTAFVTVDGVAMQQPLEGVQAPLRILDVPAERTDEIVAAEVGKPFDLGAPPLARWLLLRHGAGENTFIHVEHHFVHDGWSLSVLLSELSALYPAFAAGQPSPLPDLPIQYADYTLWQREWMRGEVLRTHVDHWTALLSGAPSILELPADHPRPPVQSFRGAAPRFTVPAGLSRALRSFSRQHRVSLFSTMYAGFAALLYRYTGQQDLLVGTGAANRGLPELEPLLGMLVNSVVLRTRVGGQMSFTELLDQVQGTVVDALAWSDTPVDAVIDAIGPARDPSRTPLFQVMFSFHDSAVPDLEFGGLSGTVTERANGSAKCDLNVVVVPRGAQRLGREPRPEDDDLSLIWEYSTDLFDETTMAQMVAHYLNLLTDALARPEADIGGLELLTAAESAQLESWSRAPAVNGSGPIGQRRPAPEVTTGWPRTNPGYPADATIPALFAAQVARDPGATALVFGGESVSYAELDRRSNALAWLLRRRGVGTDTTVGVAMERGPGLVTTLLAVLKAGGAYVPIHIGTPAPRVAAMLTAGNARLVLVTAETAAAVPQLAGVELVRVDAVPQPPGGEPGAPPDVAHPLSLACILFTSGSTGVPKGISIPQRGVVRLISDPAWAPLGPGERLLLMSPVAFDLSTMEIWGALLTGATAVIAPPGRLGLADVAALLRTSGVTVVWLTAGLFHQVAETDIDALAAVGVLMSGGDVLDPETMRAVLAARRGRPVVAGYGPAENTTFTSCHVMTDPSQVEATVPIGRPIQYTTVRVLDARGRPVPIGVTGELCTGGDGLARGYAGNAAATAEKFVPDPYGHGTRLYRSGDLVRWRADGTLDFVGRVDNQVKIRGFRVEPGDVAAVLRAHPDVRESVVLVAGEGEQRHLIGYVTPADGVDPAALRPSALRDFVAQRLPDYLVPAGFKALGRFPLTANGKVDRAALPAPEHGTDKQVTPPHGPTEERLAGIWQRLLPQDGARHREISREDTFFGLGGNSLSAARLMFRIGEEFGVELSLAAFYETPTLAACATAIDAARPAGQAAATAPQPALARPVAGSIGRTARLAAPRATPARPATLAPHLVRLTEDWALWRTVCLRGAGFPLHLLEALGDAGLARAADAVIAADASSVDPAARDAAGAAYAAEFPAAIGRLSAALHEAAGLPALREAVAWQNRHALTTGIDPLVRHGAEPAKRGSQQRQHEALVASYLQRYCAKNDSIGFFGPLGWSQIDDDHGIRITHAGPAFPLAARATYLEGWAVRGVMADHAIAMRPWLVPRRMPFVGVDGTLLRVALTPPIPLTAAEAAVMRACDGIRDASEIAAALLADPSAGFGEVADVFAVMTRLADSGRLAWQVDVAPQDLRPERTVRALLSRVTDDTVRGPAEKALDELITARDELASAAGDAERVAVAMAALESTFTRLSGLPPTRREGKIYAGRTVAYEECLRGDTVRLGADVLDGLGAPLALVLDSARWFITVCGALYARHFRDAYRQRAAALGTDVVPFVDVWMLVNDTLSDPPRLIGPAIRALEERWSAVLDLPPGARRVQLAAAELRERVTAEFPDQALPWPVAVHHSPDLMIAGADAATGGRPTWVLGEVHPSMVTMRYASWQAFHDASDALCAAVRHDLQGPTVWFAETSELGGTGAQQANVLTSPGDLRVVFAHDSCGYDPAATLPIGECDLVGSPAGLRVRRRNGTLERGLLEVIGDLISTTAANRFGVVPPGAHVPRVTIDDLVVIRETWRFAATEPGFAGTADESARYLQARAWAAGHGLPRHVFCRFTGEAKPIYADLTSLASIDLISRSLRRASRHAGAEATMTVVEMLPAPDQVCFTDGRGLRYTTELRMVAVDQRVAHQR
jgi:amino acid adenylation domain-containing protein